MTTVSFRTDRFDMSGVIERTFSAIGANFVLFYGLSLLITGAPSAIWRAWLASIGPGADDRLGLASVLLGFPGLVLYFASAGVLQGVLAAGVVSHLDEQPAEPLDLLRRGGAVLLPLALLSSLMAVALACGLCALLVPGLVVLCVGAVAVPALAVEGKGPLAALERSRALTRRHRASALMLAAMYALSAFILTAATGIVARLIAPGASLAGGAPHALGLDDLTYLVVTEAVSSFFTLIGAVGVTSLYFELRSMKEGVRIEQLARRAAAASPGAPTGAA